jgi:hypothetical protein
LDNVVAVLVRDQHLGVVVQLQHHGGLVFLGPVLQDPLDNTAAVLVGGELADVALETVHDEVDVAAGDQGDGLLNDVVSVLVLGDLEEVVLQFLCQLGLLFHQDVLESLHSVSFRRENPVSSGRRLTFWTTRQAYACTERSTTLPFMAPANTFFWI